MLQKIEGKDGLIIILKEGEKISERFEGAMAHLTKEEKRKRDRELKALRNEWERKI